MEAVVTAVSAGASMMHEIRSAYAGQTVLLTGHTGFKGGWLALWLKALGARVVGYSLAPLPLSVFETAAVEPTLHQHEVGDIRDLPRLVELLTAHRPAVVFHLAAQALVKPSYEQPLETMSVNAMGTATLLEAVRQAKVPCAVVVVSSDKCYENREWVYGYREDDALGGHDVYSMSKGATELVTSSWRRSFFDPEKLAVHGVAVGSARAGNVIGGGDWAAHRIVPDVIRSLKTETPIEVRSPKAVRPWQHVLEPLSGYLLLGARLRQSTAAQFCEAYNFGPANSSVKTVAQLVDGLVTQWGRGRWVDVSDPNAVHEASLLQLSIDKAAARLDWHPRWGFEETLKRTVDWYRLQASGASADQLRTACLGDIEAYERAAVV